MSNQPSMDHDLHNKNHHWEPTKWGLRLTRSPAWRFECDGNMFCLRWGEYVREADLIVLEGLSVSKGIIFSKIIFSFTGLEPVTVPLDGIPNALAVQMQSFVAESNQALFEKERASWYGRIKYLLPTESWLSHEQVGVLIQESPPSQPYGVKWREDYSKKNEVRDVDIMPNGGWCETPEALLESLADFQNRQFLSGEKIRCSSLFETIEKQPLTDEQVEASVCFDNRQLLVAAAGSGKTSTMVAKAAYALHRRLVKPREILMLAFNSDASLELRERVDERIGRLVENSDQINVSTFHAFGLRIIGEATGKKPRVAPWVGDRKDTNEIVSIIEALSRTDLKFKAGWLLFRYVLSGDLKKLGTKEEPEYWDRETGQYGYQTLNNETVKSREEQIIADWLFLNGINYRYESPYEHDTTSSQHGQYYPDFYYPDIGLYHEHFALDKEGNPPTHFRNYAEGVQWKRGTHEQFQTTLIETTSATLRSGQAFEDLAREFEKRGLGLDPTSGREPAGLKPPTSDQLARTFRVFMAHVKSNRLTHDDLSKRLDKQSKDTFKHRHRTFLMLYHKIADEWQSRLRAGNFVDFEDMLNDAADLIEAKRWQNPYKLIMVDEFQDTSRARARLVSALLDRSGLFLFAVGDDWQSINRFAGADISVMRDFDVLFNHATTSQLTKTFRCPQSLCDISSQFISKNHEQLTKVVVGDQEKQGGAVFCISLPDEADINGRIEKYLQQLSRLVRAKKTKLNNDGKISVLVLGRYGFDEPDEINRWQAIYSDAIELSFSTVHKAKGGEADYVIIPHMVTGRFGFPSQMGDDPVIQLAMPGTDKFPFSEERRIFYVALTRARRRVIIFTVDHMNSEFLVELTKDGLLEIKTTRAATRICSSCESGTLKEKNGRFGPFIGCSRHPRCNYTEKFPQTGQRNYQ